MVKEERILFVEGDDDLHTIWAICQRLQVEETFLIAVPDGKGKINKNARPHERGGIDNVYKATETYLIAGSNIERLGIVIDADANLGARWTRIKSILTTAGYTNLPVQPDVAGTIIKQEYLPTFGVWIMPDNHLRGMLEDFLQFLVPEDNKIWDKAVEASKEILEMDKETFSEIYLSKAQIHTYLAWQKEPGRPFGVAITAKYLQIDNPQCKTFVAWLNRLFVEKQKI